MQKLYINIWMDTSNEGDFTTKFDLSCSNSNLISNQMTLPTQPLDGLGTKIWSKLFELNLLKESQIEARLNITLATSTFRGMEKRKSKQRTLHPLSMILITPYPWCVSMSWDDIKEKSCLVLIKRQARENGDKTHP